MLLASGCSNALRWTPDYHTVRSGETLYTIAMRYDLDTRDLAAWNGHHDICSDLLAHQAALSRVNEQNYEGETALLCAAQHGHTQVVDGLIKVSSA